MIMSTYYKNQIKSIFLVLTLLTASLPIQSQTSVQENFAYPQTTRDDGRYMSSYGIVHNMIRNIQPQHTYHQGMNKKEFLKWQKGISNAMKEIMNFPIIKGQPAPKCIEVKQREGYLLEKWEFYPFPQAVATFLVLKPNNLKGPTPAILCIPGSGRTKEGLVGEKGIHERFTEDYANPKVAMGLDFVKEGYVVVAVDNAAAGETSDLEKYYYGKNYDYDIVSRMLLEMGWSWLGYTSFLDKLVVDWMKSQPYIDNKRIVVSGFSLGTEPLMVLGALDKDLYAFIYNDFLCNTQERAIVMTHANDKGRRRFPNSIRHLIPNYWKYFNFPDVVASLAPRPIIFTEGGLDRDFDQVKSAYQVMESPQNVVCYHYPKYSDINSRSQLKTLPMGLDAQRYFQLVNVDTSAHYFKYNLIIPWLNHLLKKE